MILLFMNSGPMIKFWRDEPNDSPLDGTYLSVSDLNPEVKIRFRLSSWGLFKMGLKCIWASIRV